MASSTLHTIIYLAFVKFNKILFCFVVIHYARINDFGVVIWNLYMQQYPWDFCLVLSLNISDVNMDHWFIFGLLWDQVRSTGTVDQVTRQPIKGRKKGGGIRFGEMERDSMLAHGASYLLHDRLHTCSDHHIADVCSLCGSILTSSFVQPQKRAVREIGGLPPGKAPKRVTCHACRTSKGMETVAMPYVFKYLAAELAAMNIKLTLQLSSGAAWFEQCSCLRSLPTDMLGS